MESGYQRGDRPAQGHLVGCRDEVGRGERCVLAQVFRGFLSMGVGGSPGRLVYACETAQAVLITVAGEAGSGTECVWGVSR